MTASIWAQSTHIVLCKTLNSIMYIFNFIFLQNIIISLKHVDIEHRTPSIIISQPTKDFSAL